MNNISRSKMAVKEKILDRMTELEKKKFHGRQRCEIVWQDGRIMVIENTIVEREKIK